jgi:hypothetical protein
MVFSKDIFSAIYGIHKRFCPHSVSKILPMHIPAPNPNLFTSESIPTSPAPFYTIGSGENQKYVWNCSRAARVAQHICRLFSFYPSSIRRIAPPYLALNRFG